MSKHTPGPWSIEADTSHFGTLSTVVGGKKLPHQQMTVQVGGMADWCEQEANARLIAASPDLLEACEYALNQAFSWGFGDGYLANQVLLPAIAKAKGAPQ